MKFSRNPLVQRGVITKSILARADSGHGRENDQETSGASAKVTEAEVRTVLNRIVRDSLAPLTTALSLQYIAFAVKHALTLSEPAAGLMSLTSGAGAVVGLGFRIALRRWSIPERWANSVLAMMAGLLLLTNFMHLCLVAEPHQTTNLLVMIIGAGFLFLSTRWLVLVIMATLIGWGIIAWKSPPSSAWLYYAFALFGATVLAVLVHLIRIRTLRQLEKLRIQDQIRSSELKAALAATEASQIKLRESEARYRTLVENSPDAIYVHRDGKVLYANPASARLVGATQPQQLIGKPVIRCSGARTSPRGRGTHAAHDAGRNNLALL